MTYKSIFEQNHFDLYLNSDFCIILSKNNMPWYAVYKNMGIKCFDLSTLENISIEALSDRWGMSNKTSEEYELKFSTDESYLINFIFGLIPFDPGIYPEIPNYHYWEEALKIKKDENKPALLLTNLEKSHCNVLIFDESSYRLFFPCNDCFLLKDEAQNKLLISYNPYHFLNTISTIDIDNFASLILPLKVSDSIIKSFISDRFESYEFFCTSVEEYMELLRFCCCYINLIGIENIHLNFSSMVGEIGFWILPETSPLKYIQLGANMQKDLRSINESLESSHSFRVTKKDILNMKIVSINFNLSFKELKIVLDNLITTYNLPIVNL